MARKTVLEIICALLMLLFIYTGFAKWINFSGNLHDMNNQPFPKWMATTLAYALPPVEIFVALLLVFDKTRLAGLYLYLLLMIFFTAYIAAIKLNFFPRIPCSCGGVIKFFTWTQHMWFNLFFLALNIMAIRLHKKIRARSQTAQPIHA